MDFQDKCPNCGHPRQEGAAFCSNCGKPFPEPRPESPPPSPPPTPQTEGPAGEPAEQKYVPWEDWDNAGFFGGLWETWKDSVFSPERFFARLPFAGGIGYPLLYALIVAWVGVAIEQLWGLLFSGMMYNFLADFAPSYEQFSWMPGLQTGFSLLTVLFFAPISIVVTLFILSGVFHLIMLIFGWVKRDFEATFRAISYAAGPLIFYVIPMCGGLIGWIWALVLAIIGLKHLQKATGGQATVTVLLPIILCCCAIIFIAVIFGTALLGLIQQSINSGNLYD